MSANKHKRISSVECPNDESNSNKRICVELQKTGLTKNCKFVNSAKGDVSYLKKMKLSRASGSDYFCFLSTD